MEYGQSSGMVNVDGTMMPDPTKHPELEAMVRLILTAAVDEAVAHATVKPELEATS